MNFNDANAYGQEPLPDYYAEPQVPEVTNELEGLEMEQNFAQEDQAL